MAAGHADDVGAVLGEGGGTGLADAGTGTGDDDNGVGELHAVSFRMQRQLLAIL